MKRKPYPHEELVQTIRKEITSQIYSFISDDMDMYYVEKAGYSPMERQGEHNTEKCNAARAAAEQLLQVGESAAQAVALGLRMQGRWRLELLPYAEKFRKVPTIREALLLVAKRKRDPLTAQAAWIADRRPSHFTAYIGGYMGASYQVVLQGETLVYRVSGKRYKLESEEELTVTEKDWLALYRKLERIGVPSWKERYEDRRVCDGTNWSLHLVAGELHLESSGSNAYPDTFDAFCKAVSKLIGGKVFE